MKVVENIEEDGGETTKDKLLGGRILLFQPRKGYRAALDSVLLASAVPAADGDSVMDLGSGVGSASLCLAYRVKECHIEGIEVQEPLLSLGIQNISLNGFEKRIKFILGDVSEVEKLWKPRFDHVMINPPYLPASRAQTTSALDRSRIEVGIGLREWVYAAASLVRDAGTLTFIHRADRVDELLSRVREVAGDISVFPIWPSFGKEAKRVIVRGRKGRRGPVKFCAGLVLHDGEGQYTISATQILYSGGALEF